MIDEFQDINSAQYELIEALATPEMNLFAVGDKDQTIYAFRGSSGEFIDRFVSDFNARLIPLGLSYRCSNGILFAAGSLIGKNRRYYLQPPRPPENLKEHPPIRVFEVEDESEEALMTSKLVQSWVAAGSSFKDIAILYRVHNLADECERVLIEKGIPTLRLTPGRAREEIPGDPLPILRLAVADIEWDWERALGLPRDRLDELDDLRVREIARREGITVATLLGRPTRFKHLSALTQHQLSRLNAFVRALKKGAKTEAPSALLNMAIKHINATRSPWRPKEDAWLAAELACLAGFDKISVSAILEEWRSSPEGIRIYHAPTISALIASRLIQIACTEIIGVNSDLIPLPIDADGKAIAKDRRPVVMVGLNISAEAFFPSDYLFHRALYVTPSGIATEPEGDSPSGESFGLAMTSHRLAMELVGYRPGGGPDDELVFFDLETTRNGYFPGGNCRACGDQGAFERRSGDELGHFHSLVNPGCQIPPARSRCTEFETKT